MALIAISLMEAISDRFDGWSPPSDAPNDFTTVDRLYAVFLCLNESRQLRRPALE